MMFEYCLFHGTDKTLIFYHTENCFCQTAQRGSDYVHDQTVAVTSPQDI
jgi:hypothetical protein